ncbi:hydroxymethylbilane synthase [Acetivibrio clariflavus]|uniref:Porphobilinogen deaminase n=1 Tax=Acetivibrio clariflavus (strain DSM 19732 / NBRC 101661 / EBR45) TaxID=720554 RepID=G8LU06_ACECE|nr:hydroxymethylbilane synthase [Acetivibrio clariflavus]AEV68394.1 hydroxymethylbilane synthase [Acetivibrio clariflavus DSM 19732]HPU41820.1 hydroxymethylbilane synthase [Acetivibrio clariflavus]
MKIIRVGSRDSKLAIIQAKLVMDAIERYDKNIKTELITMKTTGDKILNKSLDKIGGKGLFVKELDNALLNDKVDITVHSYKDIPMEINPDLPIVAVSEREDERDVLILPKGKIDKTKPIGCSSKRRTIQLLQLGYENIAPVRGNVISRLNKLDEGQFSALVLAAAGIKRLGLEERIYRYFSTEEIMPAACQGIIAVQARKGENVDFLKGFHCEKSKYIADAERAFVAALEGGCSSPVAAHAQIQGDKLILNGLYVDEKMGILKKGSMSGSVEDAQNIGKSLARKLKEEVWKWGRGL